MTITSKDTVRSIMLDRASLFSMAQDQIFSEVKDREMPDYIPLSRFGRKDRMLRPRRVAEITVQELDTIENRLTGYGYFEKLLAVMLEIEESEVENLRFIYAYRYFIELNQELKSVAKKWGSLKLPLSPKERRVKVKRPNYGMISVVRGYLQLMNGAVSFEEAWNMQWVLLYEAMESAYFDAIEQRKLYEYK